MKKLFLNQRFPVTTGPFVVHHATLFGSQFSVTGVLNGGNGCDYIGWSRRDRLHCNLCFLPPALPWWTMKDSCRQLTLSLLESSLGGGSERWDPLARWIHGSRGPANINLNWNSAHFNRNQGEEQHLGGGATVSLHCSKTLSSICKESKSMYADSAVNRSVQEPWVEPKREKDRWKIRKTQTVSNSLPK
jgi:hypothetical protein